MQDDVYILAQDGWAAAREIRELVKNSEGKFTEEPDLTIGKNKLKAELIPPPLIVARFFAGEQTALEKLEAAADEAARAVEEMNEEHGGEEGLLYEAKPDKGNEKGKVTAKSVKYRLEELKHDPDAADERKLLEQCLGLIEKEAEANRAAKEAKGAINKKTVAKYTKLTETEVKALVVEDKWLARLEADARGELDRVSQSLTGRVKLLAERYAVPMPKLAAEVEALSFKVDEHLKRMGFTV
jgi:type I restriction enzyme M protein